MILSRAFQLFAINFKLCLLELWSNKARSLITSLGIFLGVTSLLVNVAFIRAMEEEVRHNLEAIGGLNIVTISRKQSVTAAERISFQRSTGLRSETVFKLADQFDYIKSVLPQKEFRSRMNAQGKSQWVHSVAVSPEHMRVYNLRVGPGDNFTAEDHRRGRSVCIIGPRVARNFFGENTDPLGKQITLNGKPFTITGMIHAEDNISRRSRQVLLPYTTYISLFSKPSTPIENIAVELKSSEFVPKATVELRNALISAHRGAEDFEIAANQLRIEEMQSASRGMKILLGSIAVISLIVGGISIMNIMFATIGDRIKEIGIRKALGARRADLFAQFIIEAVTLCFLGGGLGMLLGGVITVLPADLFPIRPQLAIGDYLLSAFFTALTGLFSGLFPALRAAGMEPIDALRY